MIPALTPFFALLRRYPYAAACVGLALACAGGVWFLREHNAGLQVELAERATKGEAMLLTLVGGSTLREELDYLRDAVRRIDENLVVEANLAENLWYFYKLEEQTKARLPELRQLNSPTSDKSTFYRRVPYTLRVTGFYDQVSAFLLALESGPRLVKIRNFGFSRNDAASGGTITLDLSVELLGKR